MPEFHDQVAINTFQPLGVMHVHGPAQGKHLVLTREAQPDPGAEAPNIQFITKPAGRDEKICEIWFDGELLLIGDGTDNRKINKIEIHGGNITLAGGDINVTGGKVSIQAPTVAVQGSFQVDGEVWVNGVRVHGE